jgi:hypothetical protein
MRTAAISNDYQGIVRAIGGLVDPVGHLMGIEKGIT